MTKGRSTTYEERIALVRECIEKGYNYGEIAEKYKVGYQQIYTWVKKYKEKGEAALKTTVDGTRKITLRRQKRNGSN